MGFVGRQDAQRQGSGNFILHAANVNSGGGFVLLRELVQALPTEHSVHLFLDARTSGALSDLVAHHKVTWVKPTILSRLQAEWRLSTLSTASDTVLCFNGVPPVFRGNGQILVYVQNKLLLGPLGDYDFKLRTKARLTYEKMMFSRGAGRVSFFFVQTKTMAAVLSDWLAARGVPNADEKVQVRPFSDVARNLDPPSEDESNTPEYDFCYVADGQPHKNHTRLFQALELLAQDGFYPRVATTLAPSETDLIETMQALGTKSGVRLENLGQLSHANVLNLYRRSRALVYPSLTESFGLPLIEAARSGLPIVAGELNYVRDVCMPEQSFDPREPLSIARAMRRFMCVAEQPAKVLSAQDFLDAVFKGEGGGSQDA